MKNKMKIYGFALAILASTQAKASQTGIPEKLNAFIQSDLKPILAVIVIAGLIWVIIKNIGKLSEDDGWKKFAVTVGVYILIASAIGGIISMGASMVKF